MATPKIDAQIGVNMNPTGMAKAAQEVESKVNGIVKAIEKAGTAANEQLKALAIGLKQLDTLRTANAKTVMGDFNSAQGLGKQARALAEYRAGISKTSDAVGVLRGRLVALDVANGKLIQGGKTPTKGSVLNAQSIEQTANAYGKLTNQTNALRGRIALLGDDSRKAFAPMLAQLDKVDAKNAAMFRKNNKFNFKPQIDQMGRLVGGLNQQVASAEKHERVQRANLETLRAQGQQLLTNNAYERLSQRAAAVRQGQTMLRNADLTGTDVSRRASALQRMASTANFASVAERQLNAELAKPAAQQNADRIQTLINRLQILRRELGLATAEQIKNNQEQQKAQGRGGFFAGMKSVGGNLFDSPEGSGSAFGAGALVGRVGVYALAASAIYGVISAFKEGIAFSIQFEDALAQLGAVSGATAMEMDRLSSGILTVAKNSATSVLDLTKAATIIAQAGYGGEEITGMLDSVTKLADASGSTAEDSVDILTSSLGSFQLAASESGRVTDALVGALNQSKLGIGQVQLGIQYLGATAKTNNISLNELVAMLGVMADAGIRGSTAATGLRQMFIEMIDPSEKMVTQLEKIGLSTADIDVKTLGAVEVLRRLQHHGFDAYHAMETRAAAAYVAISSNIDAIGELEQATLRSGAAAEAQETRLSSTSARWQMMLNSWAEAAAMIGRELGPALRGLIAILEVVGHAIMAPVQAVSLLIGAFSDLIVGVDTVKFSQEEFRDALLETGMSAEEVANLTDDLGDSFEDLETLSNDLTSKYSELETQQGSLRDETGKLILRQDILAQSNASVANQVNILASRFPGLRSEFAKTEGGINGLITAMFRLDMQAQRTMATVSAAQMVTARAKMDDANQRAVATQRMTPTKQLFVDGKRINQADPELARFDAAVKNRQWGVAMDIAATNKNVNMARRPQVQSISSFAPDWANANNQFQNAQSNRDMAKFFSSDKGSRVSQAVQQVVGGAGYAASTNKGEADYLRRIDSQLATLDEISKNEGISEGALAGIGQLQSLLVGARSALLPDPVKEDKKSGGRSRTGRDRGQRDFFRVEADILKEEAEWKKQLYENAVKALEEAPNLDELPSLMSDVNTSLTAWLEAEGKVALAEIERSKPTDSQRSRLMEAAAKKADQLRIENIDKIAGTLEKVIKEFIDRTTKAIERQYEMALRALDRNMQVAQGRVAGLQSPLSTAPEYMKTVMQRRADVAEDEYKRAQMPANDTRIAQYTAMMERVSKERDALNAELERLGKIESNPNASLNEIVVTATKMQVARDRLRDIGAELLVIEDKTYDLRLANDVLRASYAVLGEAPKTFGDGMRMAVEAVRIDVGQAQGLGQELINNLDQPLRALHEGFKGFFSDMLSGSVSVGQAFKNLAGTVIDAINQMIAVALAKQFFSLIAGIFGAPTASVDPVSGASYDMRGLFGWGGGPVNNLQSRRIPNMYGGGSVMGGMGTRDSTLIHAAKDEYLIRRSAAQSLGTGFLNDINARGATALRDIASPQAPAVVPAPQLTSNIYLIAPEEKPQMGPNDIIATFSNDVLKGGVTKKLIKQVANGG